MVVTTKNVNVNDPNEFAHAFRQAFAVSVLSCSMTDDVQYDQTFGSYGSNFYTIDIKCYLDRSSLDKSPQCLMEYFSLRSRENHLIRVSIKTERIGYDLVELQYKCSNLIGFMAEIEDIRYKKYSETFHKQLEDILD